MDRFKYDQLGDIVLCPRGKILTPRSATPTGRWFRADPASCKTSLLQELPAPRCLHPRHPSNPPGPYHQALCRHPARPPPTPGLERRGPRLDTRHRWLVEGVHGLAKTLHGLNRAVRSGLTNMKIQAMMTAIAINLKRLAKALLLLLVNIWHFRYTRHPQAA